MEAGNLDSSDPRCILRRRYDSYPFGGEKASV
jgi:hypothetical protein